MAGSPDPEAAPPRRIREYDLDGELTVFDPDSGRAVFLNATASLIWRRLDGTAPERQLVVAVAQEFDIDPDEIADDVHAVLDELADAGLLEDREPPRRRAP